MRILRSDGLLFGLSVFTLIVALLFGGGTRQGLTSDLVVDLAALPLLALSLYRLSWTDLSGRARLALLVLVGMLLLLLAHLMSLPHEVWLQLPERSAIWTDLAKAGVEPGRMSVSLDVDATERMLWWLVAPISIFVASLSLSRADRRRLTVIVLAFAGVNLLLGLAQVAGGAESVLRFYYPTNTGDTVGFFANRNHYAALLFMCVPLAIAWAYGLYQEHDPHRPATAKIALLLLLTGVLVIGLILSRSRAGLILGMVGLLGGFLLVWMSGRSTQLAMKGISVVVLFGVIVGVQFGLYGVLGRLQGSAADDARWDFARTTLKAAEQYAPVGSGFGTFENVYQRYERSSTMLNDIVNHAHNDWVELALEGGWPAMGLMAVFLAWALYAILAEWFRTRTQSLLALTVQRGVVLGLVLVLLHEAVDYTLRTTAMACVFALWCGLLSGESGAGEGRRLRNQPIKNAAFGTAG